MCSGYPRPLLRTPGSLDAGNYQGALLGGVLGVVGMCRAYWHQALRRSVFLYLTPSSTLAIVLQALMVDVSEYMVSVTPVISHAAWYQSSTRSAPSPTTVLRPKSSRLVLLLL